MSREEAGSAGLPPTAEQSTNNSNKEAKDRMPSYESTNNESSVQHKEETEGEASRTRTEESFRTRNGLNLKSFQRRDYGTGIIELDRSMKTRHLHMIAIGGSIGAGFFVGSGKALSGGGPGSVLIDFFIIGFMMFNTVYALGELAVMYPVSGGFYTYSTRFIDPSWGFAMGWNYCLQWAVVLPLELTVCGITVQYWNQDISVGEYSITRPPLVRLTEFIDAY
jgi:amino acid permease